MKGLVMRALPLALLCVTPLPAMASEAIPWTSCKGIVPESDVGALGDDLQCGRLSVPFDHASPLDTRRLDLVVVKVRSTRGEHPDHGTIFVDGGNGGLRYPALLMSRWRTVEPTDPVDGDLRRISERMDAVTLMYRRATEAGAPNCEAFDHDKLGAAIVDPDDNATWTALVAEADRIAASCSARSGHIGTWQRVKDMEMLRTALGESRFHLLASHEGSWVAGWYASAYPQSTGRVLIDQGFDFSTRWDVHFTEIPYGFERALWRHALEPAAAADARWQLGTSAESIRDRLLAIPLALRMRWSRLIWEPADLKAALDVSAMYEATASATRTRVALQAQIESHRFVPDDADDLAARRTANTLVATLPENAGTLLPTEGFVSTASTALLCNDTAWTMGADEIRDWVRDASSRWTFWNAQSVRAGLICRHWPRPVQAKPPIEKMGTLPSILLLHYSQQKKVPLWSAERVLGELPNARLVVAEGTSHAGVLDKSLPCASRLGARYLLTGETPEHVRTTCAPDAFDPTRKSDR